MAYWKNLHFTDGMAEASIMHSSAVLGDAQRRRNTNNPMTKADSEYRLAWGNMMFLIEGVPDSDVLRAEQIAFKARNLATLVGDEGRMRESEDALRKVQERPAYLRLVALGR